MRQARPTCLKPGNSQFKTIVKDSTAGVGQDLKSLTHVPSEFNDENMPSRYSTV